MSLTIKADGDTERQLLDLLTRLSAMPQWSPPSSARTAMVPIASPEQPAVNQQQLDDLLYLAQQQQLQLEQSQRAIADYQQAFISITGSVQPALPPASTASDAGEIVEGLIDGSAVTTESIATPRYITGGLGNAQADSQTTRSADDQTTDQTTNISYQTAETSTQRQRRSSQAPTRTEKWLWRLFSLLLLFTAMTTVTWVSFKWLAPAIDNFFNLEVVSPVRVPGEEGKGEGTEEKSEVEEPASSLSEPEFSNPPVAPPPGTHNPGSAQPKAGSQPNALEGL